MATTKIADTFKSCNVQSNKTEKRRLQSVVTAKITHDSWDWWTIKSNAIPLTFTFTDKSKCLGDAQMKIFLSQMLFLDTLETKAAPQSIITNSASQIWYSYKQFFEI